jgi:CheY-like chemotaxis protein
MGEREIIIADKDAKYRNRMAQFFRNEGFHVGTADSPDAVVAKVLETQAAVLLLECGFSSKVSNTELIHLLKKCSRHLHIIMVSDEMTLSQARQVRQEGIFYHALKPATIADTEELWQAVACAFEKHRMSVLADPAPRPGQSDDDKPGGGSGNPLKAVAGVVALVALLLGTSYYLLAAGTETASRGANGTVTIFLAFCALILVNQLLPIFRIKLPSRIKHGHAAPETTPRSR